MNGRRLYELACDARVYQPRSGFEGFNTPQAMPGAPWVAWQFLHSRDKDFWNDLAWRVTPKPRKRA